MAGWVDPSVGQSGSTALPAILITAGSSTGSDSTLDSGPAALRAAAAPHAERPLRERAQRWAEELADVPL